MRWLSALLFAFFITMAIVWPCQCAPAEGTLRNQSNAKCKYFKLENMFFFATSGKSYSFLHKILTEVVDESCILSLF